MIVCKDLYRLLMEYLLLQIKPPIIGEYFASLTSIEYCISIPNIIRHRLHVWLPSRPRFPGQQRDATSQFRRHASARHAAVKPKIPASGQVSLCRQANREQVRPLHQVKPHRVFANFCVHQFLGSAFPFMSVS